MKNIKLQGYFTCKLCSAAVQYKRGIPNRKKKGLAIIFSVIIGLVYNRKCIDFPVLFY